MRRIARSSAAKRLAVRLGLPFAVVAALAFAFPARGQSEKPKPAPSQDDAKRFQPHGYIRHEHEVTISGRALNDEGEPVIGARVFVIPVAQRGQVFDGRSTLVEGKTDSEGRYRFEQVKLSVIEFAPAAVPKPTQALFQVYALAKGYGYVWRHSKGFRPEPRPAGAKAASDTDEPEENADFQHLFFADEPIVINLEFSPEVRLHGVITDDLGTPLKDATVQVGLVNSDRDAPGTPPRSWRGHYLEETERGVDGPFEGFFSLPEEYRLAKTGADGSYEIRGIPRDCSLIAYLDYRPDFEPYHTSFFTGPTASPDMRGVVVDSGEFNYVFAAPTAVQVHVADPDGQPVADVIVRLEPKGKMRRAGAFERTDDDGNAVLKLMPGQAKLIIEPVIGQPFLPQEIMVDVPRHPREISLAAVLDPAAEVIFEAAEKDTGRPIARVAFLSEQTETGQRNPVQSQLSFIDYPRTDAQGRLRAFFAPGEWQFFVDQRRSVHEFEPVAPISETFDLSPAAPTVVRFEFSRRTLPAPGESVSQLIADELQPLADLLQKQRARFEAAPRMRAHVRRNNYLTGTFTREKMVELLDSLESKTVDECLEAFRHAFPEFRGLGADEIITDGIRRRVTSSYGPEHPAKVNLFNGEEMIISTDAGRQVDLYTRENCSLHLLDLRDFWDGPARTAILQVRKPPQETEPPQRTIRHVEGAWEIETVSQKSAIRRVIDDVTGFERQVSMVFNGKPYSETRQYFPTLLSNGVAYPKLSVQVRYQPQDQVRCEVTVVDSVELLDSLPADAFVFAGPAGTNILDYRRVPREEMGRGHRAPSGVVAAPVPDVVAHRNRFAPPPEPVLKVGDVAPELKILTWLNADGKTDRPQLEGKIVVIDFWGIGCGPCVAQLPEVNAVAKHFADSKIAIVGLHDSGGDLEGVAEFAKKRNLVFPIAIDNPDPGGRSFGMTFSLFGISAIPTCAVIDVSGHVAYLGQFNQAIEIANKLAQE